VREMRVIPFGLQDISRLAATTAAPLLPLLLTIFSPEDLIMRIIKVVFQRCSTARVIIASPLSAPPA
jgi:hypothetical protein